MPEPVTYPENIVLIGMFGSGKSTIGRIIAQRLRYTLVDTDQLIEGNYRKSLQRVLDELGLKEFMSMEDKTLQSLTGRRCVVAPGGSSVYYPKGMATLRKMGPVVYLKVALEEILHRVPDISNRGTVRRGGNTIPQLYQERAPLYKKYADFTVEANNTDWVKTAETILKLVEGWPGRKAAPAPKPKAAAGKPAPSKKAAPKKAKAVKAKGKSKPKPKAKPKAKKPAKKAKKK